MTDIRYPNQDALDSATEEALRSSYCPQCGKHYSEHNDSVCSFRYFDDTVNHERGWIPSPASMRYPF